MRLFDTLLALLALSTLGCRGPGVAEQARPAEVRVDPASEVDPTPAAEAASVEPTQVTTGVTVAPVKAADLPNGLGVQGDVVLAIRFHDSAGDNLLVLSQTGIHPSGSDPDFRGAEVYGYQYLLKGGAWTQTWKIQDQVKDCPNDVTAAHLTDSLEVTDLDGDGLAETSFLYRTACRGDVSPCTQKLMMHEGATKYALRGTARIEVGGTPQGGDYEVDPAFKAAPPAFLAEARALWEATALETF